MPNIMGAYQSAQNQGGYLTPRINVTANRVDPLTETQSYNLTNGVKVDQDHWAVAGAKYIAAAPVDIIDSTAALFGAERESVNSAVYNSIGLPGFADWVDRNHGGVEVASGLLGAVAVGVGAELAAGKMAASAWFASTGLRVAPRLVNAVANAQSAAQTAVKTAAAAGETLSWYRGANLTLSSIRVGQGVAKAAVSEVAIAAALNKNTAVWSDDMSQNMLFAGLGLGVGAIGAAVFARGEVSRWANSDTIRETFSEAVDPGGYQRIVSDLPLSGKAPNATAPNLSYQLTAVALDARRDDIRLAAAAGKDVVPRRGQIKVQLAEVEHEILGRITTKGTPEVADTGFSAERSSQGSHLKEALYEDPTTMLGAQSVAKIDSAVDAELFIKGREELITARLKEPQLTKKDAARLKDLQTHTPMVLINKTWMTTKDAASLGKFSPNTNVIQQPIAGVNELHWQSGTTGKKYSIREDGLVNADLDTMPIEDLRGVHEAMNATMENNLKKRIKITPAKDAHFLQIDMAVEFEKRGGVVDWSKLGAVDSNAAKVVSLAKKVDYVKAAPELDTATRFRLNLPMQNSVERLADPAGDTMKGIVKSATAKGVNINDIQKLREEVYQTFELSAESKYGNNMDGDVFNFNVGRDGKQMAPVLGFFKSTPANKWTKFDLRDSFLETQTSRIGGLVGQKRSPLIQTLASAIMQMPGAKEIMDVTKLADSQIGGNANLGAATASQFLTQAHRFRNSATLLAAQAMRRVINRVVEQNIDEVLKPLSPYIQQLGSIAGTRSRVLVDQYFSNTSGWDIVATKMNADGLYEFVLDANSVGNQNRLGRQLQKGETLVNERTGKPIVLDDLGNEYRMAYEGAVNKLLDSRNVIREARGLDPIKKRKFYTPPRSTRGKFVAFTLGPDNKPVLGMAIVADSAAKRDSAMAVMQKDFKAGDGKRIMTQEEIHAQADLWDQAELDFIDPTRMAAPSVKQTGALGQYTVDANSLEHTLNYLKRGYEEVGSGVVRTIFDSQLKLAGAHAAALTNTKGAVNGAKNIYETYIETLMGTPASVNPRGASALLQQVDKVADGFLEAWNPVISAPGRVVKAAGTVSSHHIRAAMDMAGIKDFGGKGIRNFSELVDGFEPYMPFKSAVEYADYVHGIEVPWKSKDLARHVNRFATGTILRWLEMPHAIMNMAGIITNMPGVLGQRNVPLVGKVNGAGIVDSTMIMSRAFKRMFREGDNDLLRQKLSPDWDMMVRNGDTTQDAAELHTQMSLLKPGNHSAFNKFLFGDPTAKGWRKLGVEGAVSIVTDTSESISRRWAHFTGLELADYHGIVGLEARHQFARDVANQAIANYDPLNRPEIFQNAFGSMYGLFLSYAQNYYQRLFSFMEVGDYKAMGRTLAVQGAMFGFNGLPGARQLADMIGGEEDGEGLMNGIYERFGPGVGSVVAQGGFSQLVTLFGLPPVALQTRGDANFRHPALDSLTTGLKLPVGLEVLKDIVTGVTQSVGSLANPKVPNSTQYAAEILARNMPNRMLRGTISVLAAGGRESDAYGNMMSETTSGAETAFRVLGLRSSRQQAEIDAYFMNQKAQQIDAQKMDVVRSASRALIRSGDFDRLPEVFDSYIEAGGPAWNYSNWIQGLIRDATQTRTQNQLLRSLRNPAHQDLAHRIQLFTAPY